MNYQYEFTNRSEQVKSITFKNTVSIDYIEKIILFKEEEISGVFERKEFRYSFDNVIWTNWNTLTQGNINAIDFQDQANFYLEVNYVRTGVNSGNIERFYILYVGNVLYPLVEDFDASIDADFLGGEPPSYYLNRSNFFGTEGSSGYFAENVDGSGIGVYDSAQDTSRGTTFFFKRIYDSSTIFITDSSGIITLDASIVLTDASVAALYGRVEIIDGSITYLSNYDAIQDVSIASGGSASADASIVRLDNYDAIQDSSILAIDFTGLIDTPSSYSGEALKIAQINSAETALEFTNTPSFSTVAIGTEASSNTLTIVGDGTNSIFNLIKNDGWETINVIEGTGYIGINKGTTAPQYPLDISGKLKSTNGYILGSDISLLPVTNSQSAITAYWGIQLVGNFQSSIDYSPSVIGTRDDFSVIIPNQQADKIGLIVKGATSQTGNLQEWHDASANVLASITADGSVSITGGNLDVSGNINTRELFNSNGVLKIQPDVQGNVELFGDTDVADNADGKRLIIHRRAAEGNASLQVYVDQYNDSIWRTTGLKFIVDDGWAFLRLEAAGLWLNQTGQNADAGMRFYSYITAAGVKKYVELITTDVDDKFHIRPQDTSILGMVIDMPLEVADDILLTGGNGDIKSDSGWLSLSSETGLTRFRIGNTSSMLFQGSLDFAQTVWATRPATGNSVVLGHYDYISRDFDHAAPTDPTLFIHSATDPNTDNTEWTSLSHDQTNAVINVGKGNLIIGSGIGTTELSADPDDPAEGQNVTWQSDGTGSGDDGDIMMKITAGATTKTITLVDFSAS